MKPTPNPTPNGSKPPANAEVATVKTLDNGPAVIVFGRNAYGIPQAAWFPASEADLATRAEQRWRELGETVPLTEVEAEMRARDARDSGRGAAPLRRAEDAVLLDTTELDADAAFERVAMAAYLTSKGSRAMVFSL